MAVKTKPSKPTVSRRRGVSSATSKPKDLPPQHQEQQPGDEYKMTPKPEYIRKNYKGSNKLKDKVALITGGDSGIGRAVAVHYAREGADVAIIYLNEDRDANDTKKLVEKEGRACLLLKGDIADPEFCHKAVDQVMQKMGQLDVLVNNAAEQHPDEDFKDISDEQLKRTFDTNILSMFYLTKAALKHIPKGGAIINTTSITSYRGSEHLIDYASTKAAIVGFTRSLSANLAEEGIRVNGVAPGPIWTPLIPASFSAEQVSEFGKDVPMKRVGQPSEVAPCYVFLACEDASYMTGQVLHPNGGTIIGG